MHVLIPIKSLARAKTRLAGVLDAGQRRSLMLALLEDVVEEAFAATAADDVSIVSSDEQAAEVAILLGAGVVSDGALQWNRGLQFAVRQLKPRPDAVLFLSADLPAVRSADIDALIAAVPSRGVVVGRAHDGGTNALAVRPPHALVPNFGAAASALVHQERARHAGLEAVIVDRPGIALDLDTPDDLARALRTPACRGRAWRIAIGADATMAASPRASR